MNLQHIAIIPDGNRRWAKAHLLLPWQGHSEGVKRFWETATAHSQSNIKYITFWAGSYSNLQRRSKQEISALFNLFKTELSKPEVIKTFTDNHIVFQVIGEWEDFNTDKEITQLIANLTETTKTFAKHTLTLLFGYDGQREMLAAIKKLQKSDEEATEELLRNNLWTSKLPDVDYVIRTGGEPHWSAGFLMWHTANSQFYFTDTLWPDFTSEKYKKALDEYETRERRMGK